MYFYYGPERERWETVSMTSANTGNSSLISSKRHFYFGNYERIVENNTVTEQYFLDNGVILIKKDGVLSFYQAFFDTQGSILSVFAEDGEKVFDASYDAWGRQTVVQNDIDLERGYCGHVMLPFDNLIDMGGRVYDSAVGRFLSCDNYVQEPNNSQNFNRYSYCLNNPLRYTDPTGELFGIDDAIIAFALFNMGSSMMQAAFNGQNVWKAAGISLLSSAATYGIGQAFGGLGGFWNEAARAGAHGLSSGLTTALNGGNFFNGFASGALSSGIGSFAQGVKMPTMAMVGCTTVMGGLTSWATGGDFWQRAIDGLRIGMLNHAQHDNDSPYKSGIIDGQEGTQYINYLRNKVLTDTEFKKKIISEIEADGVLDFAEAKLWYQIGDGTPINVQASKLELRNLDVADYTIGQPDSYNCFGLGNKLSEALVYGNIRVMRLQNNSFEIKNDIYDFDIHWNDLFSFRNFATFGASLIHGNGTPFVIHFKGLWIKR